MLCNLSKHNTTYTIQIQTLSVKCSHKGTKKGNMAMKTFKTILGGRIVTGLEMRSQREKILSRDFFR